MKIGTDAVLLGAWWKMPAREISNPPFLLDIGTGTGLLALMLAQMQPQAQVYAVEIDPLAAAEATQNVQNSPFAERIQVHAQAVQDFSRQNPSCSASFDAIICNPPYFETDKHLLAKGETRQFARATLSLDFAELLTQAKYLLRPTCSSLTVILPCAAKQSFLGEAVQKGFYLHRQTVVVPKIGKPANRVLLTLSTQAQTLEADSLTLRTLSGYTTKYAELVQPFYPNFTVSK